MLGKVISLLSILHIAYAGENLSSKNMTSQWLKDHLRQYLTTNNLLKQSFKADNYQNCDLSREIKEDSHSLFVFMSFSLEDGVWVQFSKEIEKLKGIFVICGLPENSFKELAERIFVLREKGVSAPIKIHPKLFQEYDVQAVPAIVVTDKEFYDKIIGNLSIGCALEKMAFLGETKSAKRLYSEWKNRQNL